MPHIALITTSYPDGVPGSEAAGSFVADFARELSTRLRVTVLAASTAESVSNEGSLSVRRFTVPKMPLSLLRPMHPGDWLPIVRTLKSGREALQSLANEDIPDHILALWALPGGYWAEAVARQKELPFSIWALGSDIWGLGKIPLVRTTLRSILRRADYRYADGLQLATDVEDICGKPCQFLPSTRQLPRPDDLHVSGAAPYKLAFLGRWHVNKGIDLLLDALLQLSDSDWDRISEIRINGGGPLADSVANAVQDLSHQGRPVVLGGYLDKQEATDLIAWADYLLLPSRVESIPVIFSDAMQLATPIVTTPVGDLPRLMERFRYGIISSEISAPAYADALRSALNEPASEFQPQIEKARAEFDLAAIVSHFLQNTGLPVT
jgi:glycosyltransferase involved in cell wall biosynthesis